MNNTSTQATITRRQALAGVGAPLIPLFLTGATASLARAQEASPAPAGPDPALAYTVQYQHPEKVYFYLPGMADDLVRASLYGTDVETYLAIRAEFEGRVHHTAMELLADDAFAAKVGRLPFEPGEVVAAIGESDTDDLQSWFEILRHLVTMHRPDDNIKFVNAGISGQDTAQALGQVGTVIAQQPAWLLCLLGGNDVLRNGLDAAKTEVSIEETEKNLTEMRRLATEDTSTSWVWLTRPPIDETRVAKFPGFQMGGITFMNADVQRVNDFIRSQPEPVVDLYATFGDPSTELLGPDGVHAALDGQAAIARTVVDRLTS